MGEILLLARSLLNFEQEDDSMADIKPFKAYRPAKEKVSKIAALPYDVYSSMEAREIVKKEIGLNTANGTRQSGFLSFHRPSGDFL